MPSSNDITDITTDLEMIGGAIDRLYGLRNEPACSYS